MTGLAWLPAELTENESDTQSPMEPPRVELNLIRCNVETNYDRRTKTESKEKKEKKEKKDICRSLFTICNYSICVIPRLKFFLCFFSTIR